MKDTKKFLERERARERKRKKQREIEREQKINWKVDVLRKFR